MVNFVVKKDGEGAAFDVEKVKAVIVASAGEAGMSEEEAASLASKVSGIVVASFGEQEEVSTVILRDKIMAELEIQAPQVADAWKKYEESKI